MVKVSTVGFSDRGAVAEFLAQFPGETRDKAFWEQRFQLWWDLNPAFTNGAEGAWAIRDGSQVVGFVGDVPSLFRIHQRSMTIRNVTTCTP